MIWNAFNINMCKYCVQVISVWDVNISYVSFHVKMYTNNFTINSSIAQLLKGLRTYYQAVRNSFIEQLNGLLSIPNGQANRSNGSWNFLNGLPKGSNGLGNLPNGLPKRSNSSWNFQSKSCFQGSFQLFRAICLEYWPSRLKAARSFAIYTCRSNGMTKRLIKFIET